jgi:hypothetical protein
MTSLIGSAPPPSIQQAPAVTPPPTMPDSQSPDVLAAKRNAEQVVMNRAGRSSTILSSAMSRGDSGGGSYSSTKLGAGA